MIQHRHYFPGYQGPSSSNEMWWHDENMVHKKYPTAHNGEILETRVKGESNGKRSTTTREDNRQDSEATRAKYVLQRIT